MDARVSEVVAAALEETDAAEPKALAASDSAASVSGPCQSDSDVHGPCTLVGFTYTLFPNCQCADSRAGSHHSEQHHRPLASTSDVKRIPAPLGCLA